MDAGMPEELAIAKSALARSFDVLALTPQEKVYRCWDTEWPDQSEDIPRVRELSLLNIRQTTNQINILGAAVTN